MATSREQIEHLEHEAEESSWKMLSHSRKWLKKQMSRYMRRKMKDIDNEENYNRKRPYKGWEY